MISIYAIIKKCIFKYKYKLKKINYYGGGIYIEYYSLGNKLFWTKHIKDVEYKLFSSKDAFILGTLFLLDKQKYSAT